MCIFELFTKKKNVFPEAIVFHVNVSQMIFPHINGMTNAPA